MSPKSIRRRLAAVKLARMRLNAPPISELRLQRYHRWMLLWLTWVATFLAEVCAFAPLSRQATQIAHQWLDRAERLLVSIVLIRAAARVRTIPTLKHALHRRRETHLTRAIIGSAMRRMLRPKRLDQRIAALSQNLQSLVARLLKRLPRGLTRRRPVRTRHEMRAQHGIFACDSDTVSANTS